MKTHRIFVRIGIVAACVTLPLRATAQSFDLSWHTVDGGGGLNSTGGAFTLSGTIGQADAQTQPVMAGGSFELVGGFWPAAVPVCTCPGDMNGDTNLDGLDIQQFVQCVVTSGVCSCADVDGAPGVNIGDVSVFVDDLLAGAACP